MDSEQVKKAFNTINTLRKRTSIVNFLCENKRCNVTEVVNGMDIDHSYASRCLRELNENGLVYRKKIGKEVFYRPNLSKLEIIQNIITS